MASLIDAIITDKLSIALKSRTAPQTPIKSVGTPKHSRKIAETSDKLMSDAVKNVSVNHAEMLKAAQNGDREAQYQIAMNYLGASGVSPIKKGDSSSWIGFYWLRKAAELGHAAAQSDMGSYLICGVALKRDPFEAEKWFRIAAEQGYVNAQFNLGMMLKDGDGVPRNYKEAAEWFKRASIEEDSEAIDEYKECLELAAQEIQKKQSDILRSALIDIKKLILDGSGKRNVLLENLKAIMLQLNGYKMVIEKSLGQELEGRKLQKAMRFAAAKILKFNEFCCVAEELIEVFLEISARLKLNFDLKSLSEDEKFCEFYYKIKKADQLKRARDFDERESKIQKEKLLAGVKPILFQAFQPQIGEKSGGYTRVVFDCVNEFRKRAESGDAEKQLALADYLMQGSKVNKLEGVKWYFAAARQGNAIAAYRLGYHFDEYSDSKSKSKYLELAEKWYLKSALHGYAIAYNNLGRLTEVYRNDLKKAAYYYEKAALMGCSAGQYNMGRLYEYGMGVELNLENAEDWYRKAIENGYKVTSEQREQFFAKRNL